MKACGRGTSLSGTVHSGIILSFWILRPFQGKLGLEGSFEGLQAVHALFISLLNAPLARSEVEDPTVELAFEFFSF